VLLTKEGEATLGNGVVEIGNPIGVVPSGCDERRHNPVGVGKVKGTFTQGSSFLATLGFEAESRWDSSFLLPAQTRVLCRLLRPPST
jgi:hypothetical protein